MSTTTSDITPESAVITTADGTISFRWAELPFTSQFRLAKGGVQHMLGNEVASQVVNAIRKELGHSKATPVSKEQIQAWRAANPEKENELDAQFTAEKVKAIREGTLLDRAIITREPARSPVDKLALAKMEIAVQAAFEKTKAAKEQLKETFSFKPADVRAKVKEYAQNETAMARYRAEAQAELARANEASADAELDDLLAA